MGTINFYLKSEDKKGECPIYLTYQKRGEKFRYFTKLKIPSNSWNGSRVKMNYTGYSEMNSILDDIENSLKEIEREAVFNKKEYSIETTKRKFLLKYGVLNNTNDFFNVFDKFIEESAVTKSNWTIKGYNSTKHKLLKYAEAKNVSITFENIDQTFYEAFMKYMIEDLGNLNNTTGKYIKNLKVFLLYALEHEYTNKMYNFKKFKVYSEDATTIYLTELELLSIFRKQFLPKHLLNVRDVFCFACFTGLRFSDIDKLNNSHIKGDYLEIKTDKTKDYLRIPLNVYAKEILKKYHGRFTDRPLPTGITNQKTNAYLKEIGELCKINDLISTESFSGSRKKVCTEPKYKFITTHTARRTFVTLALEKGIRAEVVMSMTGHRSYKSFMKYIKITDKVKEQEMNRVWGKSLLRAI